MIITIANIGSFYLTFDSSNIFNKTTSIFYIFFNCILCYLFLGFYKDSKGSENSLISTTENTKEINDIIKEVFKNDKNRKMPHRKS
jgi:hypothetical protein